MLIVFLLIPFVSAAEFEVILIKTNSSPLLFKTYVIETEKPITETINKIEQPLIKEVEYAPKKEKQQVRTYTKVWNSFERRKPSETQEETKESKQITKQQTYKEKPLKLNIKQGSGFSTQSLRPMGAETTVDPVKTRLENNVLNLSFYEKNSGSSINADWYYLYDSSNWGDSSYYEHFAVYTEKGKLIESEDLNLTTAFSNNSLTYDSSVLKYNSNNTRITIKKEISVPSGDSSYFTIKYTLTPTTDVDDLRFYQAVDFDVPKTGSSYHCNDNASYSYANDYTVVEDDAYFKNGFQADRASARHNVGYYNHVLFDDWDNYNLDNNDNCEGGMCFQNSCQDPAIALQYNLGNLAQNQAKTITFTFWFGQPSGFLTKEIDIYPAASFDQQTKQLTLSAYIHNKEKGTIITSGSVNYEIYNKDDLLLTTGSLTYSNRWQKNIDLSAYSNNDYYAKITYKGANEKVYFSKIRNYGEVRGYVLLDNNPEAGVNVKLYKTSKYFRGYSETAQTISNSTGGFSFTDIQPGAYVIDAVKGSNQGRTISFNINGKNSIKNNVTLAGTTKLNSLTSYMNQLKLGLLSQMDYETDLAAEISTSARDDLKQSSNANAMEKFVTGILKENLSVETISNVVKDFADRYRFSKAVNATIESIVSYNPNSIVTKQDKKDTLWWGIKDFPAHTAAEFKVKKPFPQAVSQLLALHEDFNTDQAILPGAFDINLAAELIAQQKNNLMSDLMVMPKENISSFNLKKNYDSYKENTWGLSILGDIGKSYAIFDFSKQIMFGNIKTGVIGAIGSTVALISRLSGAGTQFDIATTIVKISVNSEAVMNYVFVIGSWINDMQLIPNIYEENSNFLKNEANSPYYLDSTKDFNSTILTIDLNQDYTTGYGAKVLKVTTGFGTLKNATITIQNKGDNSEVRTVIKNSRIYNVPRVKQGEDIFEKGATSQILRTGYFNDTLTQDEIKTKKVEYTGYIKTAQSFLPHMLEVQLYNGPFMTYSQQEFYYTAPITTIHQESLQPLSTSSLSDSKGKVNLEEFENKISKPELLFKGNLK